MNSSDIQLAADILSRGGLVALPTETVYGLGADARNPEAVRRIFDVKGRPIDRPLSILIADSSWIPKWASYCPPEALKLAETCWPGPLTLILPKRPYVIDELTAGQPTIGLRCPAHPLTLQLLRTFGSAIAAPSANRFGQMSPTEAAHVRLELGDRIDYVLDGGVSCIGIESTIIDYTHEKPVLLRSGGLPAEKIEAIIGQTLIRTQVDTTQSGVSYLRVSVVPLRLMPLGMLQEQLSVIQASQCVILAIHPEALSGVSDVNIITMPSDPTQYAQQLYRTLRQLDAGKWDEILVEKPPLMPQWQAVSERLLKIETASAIRTKPCG